MNKKENVTQFVDKESNGFTQMYIRFMVRIRPKLLYPR